MRSGGDGSDGDGSDVPGRQRLSTAMLTRGLREGVTVLSGAGISTESGIPDFRGPRGQWRADPQAARLSTLRDYLQDPEVRREAWRRRLAHPAWQAQPNAAHRALAMLQQAGVATNVVTQNIDELHQRAGLPGERVVELHGSLFGTECTGCGRRAAMSEALDRVRAGDPDPCCQSCGGIVKSGTVAFGQRLDPAVLTRARNAVCGAGLLLIAGSSLTVQPAAGLVSRAARADVPIVINNAEPTPYDAFAAVVLPDSTETEVPAMVDELLSHQDRHGLHRC